MRRQWMIGAPAALLLAFGATVGPSAFAQSRAVLPKDSVLKVKLDDRLSSQSSQPGDRLTATLTGQGAGYDLPSGTRVVGTVTDVQPATSDRPGSLDVAFNALKLPNGETYPITGTPISLDSSSVEQTSNGMLMAKRGHQNDKMKFLAYGAGAGFVIGSLLGSNIKGALAGGAAGYLYGLLNKNKASGHDVVLKPGTEFGVRLDQRVSLASYNRANYRQGFTGSAAPNAYNPSGYGASANNRYGANGYSEGYSARNGYGRRTAGSAYPATRVVLPVDSVLKVKLDDRLSSTNSQPGDRFTATLTGQGAGEELPAGTRVVGEVTQVQPADSHRPGTLDVQFNALRLPDGQTYRIAGAPISLDSKSVERTSSGALMARPSQRNKNTKFIGYGAGAGLLIGSLLGSNVEGALAGGAAGYLYGQFHKNKANGHDVVLKPGTEFGVRLDQRVAIAPGSTGYGGQSRVMGYRSSTGEAYQSGQAYAADRNGQPYAAYRGGGTSLQYSRQAPRVLVNGQPVPFGSVLPIRSGNQVLVPVVPVLTAAGANFTFDRTGHQVTLTGPHAVHLTAGNSYATVDGRRLTLSEPTRIVDGWLYAPPDFFRHALDMQTRWNASSGTLSLTPRSGE